MCVSPPISMSATIGYDDAESDVLPIWWRTEADEWVLYVKIWSNL